MRPIVRAVLVGIVIVSASSLAVRAMQAPAASAPAATTPAAIAPRPVGSMSELMIRLIYPTSDAVFYVMTRTPHNDVEWGELQTKTLTLAESANLLMMPGRARDQDQWMADAKRMYDAGQAAYRAARAKNLEALDALNDDLYQSCVECHRHYRPNYGRGATPPAASPATPPAPPTTPPR